MTPDEFVQRLLNHYGSPEHVVNKKALKDDYVAALNGTDDKVLQEASDRLLKTHQFRVWPTVGECVLTVHEVADEWARLRRRQKPQQQDDYREPTPEEKARISALVAGLKQKLTAMGDGRAAKPQEDWSRTMRPAWDERLATSDIAQQFALPREHRRR